MLFMVDDSKAEQNSIQAVFPKSVILLCTFHIQQAVWRWIWKAKNGIPMPDRNSCINVFRQLLYSESEAQYLEVCVATL